MLYSHCFFEQAADVPCLLGAVQWVPGNQTETAHTISRCPDVFSVHLCCTLVHTKEGVADRFVQDVRECTAKIMEDPKAAAGGQVCCIPVVDVLD